MVNLKDKLIKKIKETNDPAVLDEIYRLLKINEKETAVYELSEDQINAINQAQEQIGKGEYSTNDQARKKIEEWLKNR